MFMLQRAFLLKPLRESGTCAQSWGVLRPSRELDEVFDSCRGQVGPHLDLGGSERQPVRHVGLGRRRLHWNQRFQGWSYTGDAKPCGNRQGLSPRRRRRGESREGRVVLLWRILRAPACFMPGGVNADHPPFRNVASPFLSLARGAEPLRLERRGRWDGPKGSHCSDQDRRTGLQAALLVLGARESHAQSRHTRSLQPTSSTV